MIPNVLSPQHLADPWPGLAVLRDHHPILWHEPTQSWMISRYEHVRPLLRDNKRCSTEHMQEQLGACLGETTTLAAMDGKEHTAHRSLVSPFLHSGGLETFTATIAERAHALLDPIFEREKAAGGRGAFDFVRDFSSTYPVDVVAAMMDLPKADYGRFQGWYNAFINFVGNIAGDPVLIENGLRANREFGEYILPIIAQRRERASGADLITQLTQSEVSGQMLSDQEIRTFLALVVLAGGETTDHQLAALLQQLLLHPDQLAALQADRSLLDAAMAEGMRYCSTAQFIQRTCREAIELDGHTFPAGSRLTLMLGAANHDPRRFADADRFDIMREDNSTSKAFTGSAEHVAFGGGRHQCVGSHLSRREVEIAMNLLLDNATDLRFADGYEPVWSPNPFIRSLTTLEITYQPI